MPAPRPETSKIQFYCCLWWDHGGHDELKWVSHPSAGNQSLCAPQQMQHDSCGSVYFTGWETAGDQDRVKRREVSRLLSWSSLPLLWTPPPLPICMQNLFSLSRVSTRPQPKVRFWKGRCCSAPGASGNSRLCVLQCVPDGDKADFNTTAAPKKKKLTTCWKLCPIPTRNSAYQNDILRILFIHREKKKKFFKWLVSIQRPTLMKMFCVCHMFFWRLSDNGGHI